MKKCIMVLLLLSVLVIAPTSLAATSNDYVISTPAPTPTPTEEPKDFGEIVKEEAVMFGESVLANNKVNLIVLLGLGIALAIVLKRNSKYKKDE